MAYKKLLVSILFALLWFMASTARPLPLDNNLSARLKLDVDEEEGGSCWDSLFELQSCTGEVILFFLNGETSYIGPSCCSAIRTIEHQCWPAMLGSLGFSSQEGDVLRGYCDANAAASASGSGSSHYFGPPPPSPAGGASTNIP